MLEHGGRLQRAAEQYHIPIANWLDLSTGINPHAWPVPAVDARCWQRLPEPDDDLVPAAQAYYDAVSILPTPGSQAALQTLPRLRSTCRVGLLTPGYAEHWHAWQQAGHEVVPLMADDFLEPFTSLDVAVLCHPNNPTGDRFTTETLLARHAELAERGGWLIVDEAFMDPEPQSSLMPWSGRDGLIVLRSLGKFFGLAGARVGFVATTTNLLERIEAALGPWPIAGPSRFVAIRALQDRDWQNAMRRKLANDSVRLQQLLSRYGLEPGGGCHLFQWLQTSQARSLHEALANRGILTRLFNEPASLRFGLPGDEQDWRRLTSALDVIVGHAPSGVDA